MKNSRKKIFLVGLFLSVLTFASFAQIKSGSTAPDFEVELLDGTKTSLYKLTSSGKTVLLNFWATWCPPCRYELPDMNELSKTLASQGENAKLDFVAVCISDSKKSWKKFMSDNNYTFKTGIDEKGNSAYKYNVSGIPATFLISSDNKILKTQVGAMTKSALDKFVEGYVD